MADVPLRVTGEADTGDIDASLQKNALTAENLAEANDRAAASYQGIARDMAAFSQAAETAGAAETNVARGATTVEQATSDAGLSIGTMRHGIGELHHAMGAASMVIDATRERMELFQKAADHAKDSIFNFVNQEERLAHIAATARDALARQRWEMEHLRNVHLTAGAISGAPEEKQASDAEVFAQATTEVALADSAAADADWARRHGGGRGRRGPTAAERAGRAEYLREIGPLGEAQRQINIGRLQLTNLHQQNEAKAHLLEERLKIDERYHEAQSRLNEKIKKEEKAAHKADLDAQRQHRADMTHAAQQWIEISGAVADKALDALGVSEAKRLFLKGLVHEGEGAALLIGSFGANPQGYALIAEGVAEQLLASQVGHGGGGHGGGHSGATSGGRGGGGGIGTRGAFSSSAGGGGGEQAPTVINIYQNGVIDTKEGADRIAVMLEGRGRRGYPLHPSAWEQRR